MELKGKFDERGEKGWEFSRFFQRNIVLYSLMKLHAVGGSREGIIMPVTEYLERNAREYPDEVALVELNPDEKDTRRTTWKEFGLIEPTTYSPYRREITWSVFNEKANRFANMLIGRGIKKGDKVAIIMYNCLEWLPIYISEC